MIPMSDDDPARGEPIVLEFRPGMSSMTRMWLFELAWRRAFSSLDQPATRTLAIIERPA